MNNNIISVDHLNFKYNDKVLFNDVSFDIKEGSWTTIIGSNGCGKTTLTHILMGTILTDAKITIDGIDLNRESVNHVRRKIGIVFENPDNQFVSETVVGDIVFGMENLQYPRYKQEEKLATISSLLDLDKLLNRDPRTLSGGEKQLIALASILVLEPRILILDEAFTMIDMVMKRRIYSLLKELHQTKNLTIINITHDIEDATYGDDIILIGNHKIIGHDQKESILNNEALLKKANYKQPFLASLSSKLMYYRLLDKPILDMNEMVKTLWK